jgi:hypothetical protein
METFRIIYGFCTLVGWIWLIFDAPKRDWTGNRIGNKTWQWIVGGFFFWLVVFPLYLVQRRRVPLKA